MRSATARIVAAVVVALGCAAGPVLARPAGPGPAASAGARSEARTEASESTPHGRLPDGVAALLAQLDTASWRRLTVQHNGRRKPMDTFAREMVEGLLGTESYADQDPLALYLWMLFAREQAAHVDMVRVRNLKLLELLGLDRRSPYTSFAAIADNEAFARERDRLHRMAGGMTLGPNQSAIVQLGNRAWLFEHLEDELRMLPPPAETGDDRWLPLFASHGVQHAPSLAALWSETAALRNRLTEAFEARDAQAANDALRRLAQRVTEVQGSEAMPARLAAAEVWMNRFHPLGWAWKLLAVAALAFGASLLGYRRGWYPFAVGMLALGTLLAAGGLAVRTVIVERAPVANIYEAVVFATFAGVVVGGVFEFRSRKGWFGAAAAVFGALAFMLADLVPALDPTIQPLQPVLRSYWLNIHVTCMLLSYGTFAIAFVLGLAYIARWFPARGYPRWAAAVPAGIAVLGVVLAFVPAVAGHGQLRLAQYLVAMLLAPALAVGTGWAWVRLTGGGQPIDPQAAGTLRQLERSIYRVVQVGFVIITAGIILGAVWANESWGRYWGWDPKETWAFITWVIYGAFIHGYMAGWFRGVRAAVWQVLGFYAVLFTFFGVSYVLPGLHSYLKS